MNRDRATQDQAALTLEFSGDGVAWLVFDRPDSKVNLLTSGVMARLDTLLGEIEAQAAAGLRGVIIRSGKSATFIAGADVSEIGAVRTEEEGYAASREGQRIFRRLEVLAIPTVVAIDGICLGGGTELALACDYRIASDRPETRIGLPEIRLGILPGFGGTTRLPRLIGLSGALPLILSGQPVRASKARRIGLVDEAVHPSLLLERAEAAVAAGARPIRRKKPLALRLIDDTSPGRAIAFSRARKQVLKETRGHYPAPLLALQTLRRSVRAPLERAFENEARALGKLIASDVCRNLIHVFTLMEGAKKAPPATTRPAIERVAVLGAGVMGGGIAQLLAYRDVPVRLKDINAAAISKGLQHAAELFRKSVTRGRMTRREAQHHMDAIAPTLDFSGFGQVDLVIEAIVERMDVKKRALREVEDHVGSDCVIASNTSSLSITEMQEGLLRPANVCGMHFFNPVHRMPLVEVIRGAQTGPDAIAAVHALARRLDKTPVIVNDGPGFLVNRVLSPYLNEAGFLLEEGASIESIDKALLEFGMPMGPLRLLDEIGLDVARHAAAAMYAGLGERMRPSAALAALEGTSLLGRKGGRGFYTYDGEKTGGVNSEIYGYLAPAVPAERSEVAGEDIRTRSVVAMINEAARVIEDGIAESAGDVDLGMITGTGFPPFRGGLLRYADKVGMTTILEHLEKLAAVSGPRFEPASLIREYAGAGRGFYR
jgi:3-hydroxyacyl-CoA dehydrogenase / enoyl-CoA hydratase / 3-hydroxybutyryl-CoA epimerase